jgi:hypothetical protein
VKSIEVKTKWYYSLEWTNLAQFSKEGYALKGAVLPTTMMMNTHP